MKLPYEIFTYRWPWLPFWHIYFRSFLYVYGYFLYYTCQNYSPITYTVVHAPFSSCYILQTHSSRAELWNPEMVFIELSHFFHLHLTYSHQKKNLIRQQSGLYVLMNLKVWEKLVAGKDKLTVLRNTCNGHLLSINSCY